ncbi:838_t:CDS:2, partial [Racocetra persica]
QLSEINFNLDIAETLLFLSAIIYERKSNEVRKAHNEIQHANDEIQHAKKIREFCENAYETICKQADDYCGLKFMPLFRIGLSNGDVIRKKAQQIWKDGNPVNIWVTGHSLVIYIYPFLRLIKTNDLMTNYCVLRDTFVFAGPAVGDNDFASSFESTLNQRFEEIRTLWRIVNANDIVPKMPPRYAFNIFSQYVTKSDFRNYFHIGHEIKLFPDGKRPQGIVSNTHSNGRETPNRGENNKTSWFELPNFIRDHYARNYFTAMEQSRRYF